MKNPRALVGATLGLLLLGASPEAAATSRFHAEATPVCNSPKLSYFGGPILQDPTILAVMWSSAVNATVSANMGPFYADVGQSSYLTWMQEYDTVGLTPGSSQAVLGATFGATYTLTPLKCAGASACALTDADVQSELLRQIGLGVLPAPTLDCTGNASTLYLVSFPPGISLAGPLGAGSSCANGGFCAYHGTTTYGPAATPLVYAALMDQFTGPCTMGCGINATPLENTTQTASHQILEAMTNPDVGLDTSVGYAAPAAWGDNQNQCGEIADICNDGGQGDPITVAGRTWIVQEGWSNAQRKCTSTGPVLPVCSGTTLTGCRLCSCGDDGNACGSVDPVCETSATNPLFGACEACTATTACPGGGTCDQSTSVAGDDICDGCVPLPSCPSGFTCGIAGDGCGAILECGTCTAPEVCAANHCVTPSVDAGADASAGASDASTDAASGAAEGGLAEAGVARDAGGTDASHADATAGTRDAGAQDAGASKHDASVGADATTAPDGGTGVAAQSGGCGCIVGVGSRGSPDRGLAAIGALLTLGSVRRRRRVRRGRS